MLRLQASSSWDMRMWCFALRDIQVFIQKVDRYICDL